jgi:hypothetical protein
MTFTVGQLRTHTHVLHRSFHCWKHRLLASFEIFWSSSVAFRFDAPHGCGTCPLGAHFLERKSQKSLGARSGECGGLRWLGDNTTRDVWLGALSWCRNHCPCLPLVVPLPLQNLHSNTVQAVWTHGAPNRQCQTIPGTFLLPLVVISAHSHSACIK